MHFFWDGGLLANTPLMQTVMAHRDYWHKVRKMEYNLPSLNIGILDLYPCKQEYVMERDSEIRFLNGPKGLDEDESSQWICSKASQSAS